MTIGFRRGLASSLLLLLWAATGNAPAAAATIAPGADGDWPTFDYNAQRSGVGPPNTEINAGNLNRLRRRVVSLDGVVDSSPIQVHAVQVSGRHRDVVVVTTSYGKTIAIDPASGQRLWEYVPPDAGTYQGTGQITTASPVLDPNRRYVYAASPDGFIHKLNVATGHQVWSAQVTLAPLREKIASALNVSRHSVIAVASGYFDVEPYDGHVVLIDRVTGAVTHVWNAICSNLPQLIVPATCPETVLQHEGDASIWARAGSVVEPSTGRILVATANGPFNGTTDWGNSVLELSPQLTLLHNWTPKDEAQLAQGDVDLGSTAPALLKVGRRRLAAQGGKQGIFSLLDLAKLDGTADGPGPRLGGELQDIQAPSKNPVASAPAVWTHAGTVYMFASDSFMSCAYVVTGNASHPRLRLLWRRRPSTTSPLVAGGLLYEYDWTRGGLEVLRPRSGRTLITLPAGPSHWNSPIVLGGRIILPEGDANYLQLSGKLDIYHLPGR